MASDMLIRLAGTVQTTVPGQGPKPAPKPVPSVAPQPAAPAIMTGSGNIEPQGGKPMPEAAAPEVVDNAVGKLNDFLASQQRNLQFTIDEYTGRSIVSVVDAETGDVIRQIPGEEVLRIARALDEMGFRLIDTQG